MDADFSEVRRFAADLSAVGPRVVKQARTVVQVVCAQTKRDAQILAPVDTGNLRNSITYETRAGGRGIVGEVGPTADYGVYVEFGTSRMGPQPYMGPATDRGEQAFLAAMSAIQRDVQP